jgi:CHAT domain-containing protein
VTLSAYKTAAGGAASAEHYRAWRAPSIYAGTRSLLVSHWAVASEATAKLITAAVAEMAGDPQVGRAEAMRRAMLALIVVVGEGAARHDGETATFRYGMISPLDRHGKKHRTAVARTAREERTK